MANNISVKNSAGTDTTVKTTDTGSVHTPHHNVDAVIPGTGATNLGKAEDAVHASGDTGIMALGVRKDTAVALAADGDYQPPIYDALGRLWVNHNAQTSGGTASYSALSTAAVIAAAIKASPGQVYNVEAFNKGASAVYMRLYNQTGSPVGGDNANIIWRGIIPGDTAGSGFNITFPGGKEFTAGIGIRVTAAIADTDNTALVANEVVVNVGTK